jgi:uncharacterized membrane protein
MTKKLFWLVMTFMALGVAGYASFMVGFPHLRNNFDQQLFGKLPLPVFLHLIGGSIAIATGAFQLNTALRTRYLEIHRWLGRTYVVAVCTGGSAAFVMALQSTGGLPAHFGFGLLAVLWVGSTLKAWLHIRAKRVALHRRWMLRSYALTLAAVTLRIYLPLSQVYGLPFEPAYITISWLCWVPNLVIVEWWILGRDNRQMSVPASR